MCSVFTSPEKLQTSRLWAMRRIYRSGSRGINHRLVVLLQNVYSKHHVCPLNRINYSGLKNWWATTTKLKAKMFCMEVNSSIWCLSSFASLIGRPAHARATRWCSPHSPHTGTSPGRPAPCGRSKTLSPSPWKANKSQTWSKCERSVEIVVQQTDSLLSLTVAQNLHQCISSIYSSITPRLNILFWPKL